MTNLEACCQGSVMSLNSLGILGGSFSWIPAHWEENICHAYLLAVPGRERRLYAYMRSKNITFSNSCFTQGVCLNAYPEIGPGWEWGCLHF